MARPRFAFRLPLRPRREAMALLAAILMVSSPGTVQAHRLNIFASTDGAAIKGTVYFQGMAPARAAHVAVFDPEGALVTEMLTDEGGRFAFSAARRVDHRIVADLEDGHRATIVVPAAQLPPALPQAVGASATATAEPAPKAQPAAIEAVVDAVVARHVGPLREQIAAYEDKIRWHDILGGIGYIVGVSGVACYFLARRRGS